MSKESPYVIAISRQLGSGGSELGERLAKRLDLVYADREILRQTAERLRTTEEDMESRDERVGSFWQSVLSSLVPAVSNTGYVPSYEITPTDREIFEAESEVIRQIANRQNAVIVGRGGFHALRNHPRMLSVVIHASVDFRRPRVQKLFNLTEEKAELMIEETDRNRARFAKTLTGREWTDLRQFHLTLDTGAIGIDAAEEAILACLRGRLGEDLP